MFASKLKESPKPSPLEQTQLLKFGGFKRNKKETNLAIALPLTSLIDAFSIIVIYLLVGTQTSGVELNVSKTLQLPTAEAALPVQEEKLPTVRVEKGQYFVNDKAVSLRQLGATLAQLKQTLGDKNELLIQADQKMDYADLDPILRAGSEAGLQKLRFAVIPVQ